MGELYTCKDVAERYGVQMLRMMWIKMAEAVKWIAVSIAVSVAIYVTGNWKLLWFFLIPMLS